MGYGNKHKRKTFVVGRSQIRHVYPLGRVRRTGGHMEGRRDTGHRGVDNFTIPRTKIGMSPAVEATRGILDL